MGTAILTGAAVFFFSLMVDGIVLMLATRRASEAGSTPDNQSAGGALFIVLCAKFAILFPTAIDFAHECGTAWHFPPEWWSWEDFWMFGLGAYGVLGPIALAADGCSLGRSVLGLVSFLPYLHYVSPLLVQYVIYPVVSFVVWILMTVVTWLLAMVAFVWCLF